MAGNATEHDEFARLVMLACHDLRTPLATVLGFTQTLARLEQLEEPASRYVEMIDAASGQLGDLVDELALGARIEAGRYQPVREDLDTLDLAREAATRLGADRVEAGGNGGRVNVDVEATKRAVAALARCALRHGGLEQVQLTANGPELELVRVTAAAAPVLLGKDLRDLGAAIAVRQLRAQGSSLELEGERLLISL
ncbi:MAG TPA: histidine kinase dimerization/phospho-acceptor domain-containing protein [Gaiellaceae bacterium]|nr:histidine kinase dimerization/phospho-acceptor domain-containing protein [Gaiellaceae bacterium]